MKQVIPGLVAALLLFACGCAHKSSEEAARDTGRAAGAVANEADTAARKAGRAAYRVADEVKDAAKKAGKEIKEASREASAGWKEERAREKAK